MIEKTTKAINFFFTFSCEVMQRAQCSLQVSFILASPPPPAYPKFVVTQKYNAQGKVNLTSRQSFFIIIIIIIIFLNSYLLFNIDFQPCIHVYQRGIFAFTLKKGVSPYRY